MLRCFFVFCVLSLAIAARADPPPLSAAPAAPPPQTTVIAPKTEGVGSDTIGAPEPPPGAWTRLTIPVAHCAAPPKIDGRLDDACWKSATHAAGFYRSGGTSPVTEQTEAWVCCDNKRLYIAFHCLDHHPELIRASETQRDSGGVTNDDFVNLDIDSQSSRRAVSSFWVTPRGTQKANLEGGTADNTAWAGDWLASAHRTSSGWDAELSIPFALLRYPRGTKSFALALFRHVGRETDDEVWPYLPPAGYTNGYSQEAQYLTDFNGFDPPFYAPRAVILPYVLGTTGTGSSAREGVDIKYPLSTTLTGVASVFPDFQTIEQDVTNVNFSYTEKLLGDRRPFFAEGSGFFPYRDLFYSRRIDQFDGGLKIAGKQGDTTLGLLATTSSGQNAINDAVLNLRKDYGAYSSAAVNYVTDNIKGLGSNQVGKLEGIYGFAAGGGHDVFQVDLIPSWAGGVKKDDKVFYQFATRPPPGKPSVSINYDDAGPNFVSNLGFNPELDRKGGSIDVEQSNHFDKGRLEDYDVGFYVESYQHHTGGFFHNDYDPFAFVGLNNGWSVYSEYDLVRRDQFHDHTTLVNLNWNQRTLYQRGGLSETLGHQEGQHYNFIDLSQGFLISRPFSVQLDYNRLDLGSTRQTQTVVTGTYRLSDTRALGGRVVSQGGQTNLYFSFGQTVRTGEDIFVLFGDPNSATTRGKITVKLVHPI